MRRTIAVSLLCVGSVIGCKSKEPAADTSATNESDLAYHTQQVADGGSISGYVRMSAPVSVPAIPITKDEGVCGENHPNPSAPGASAGVRNALIYLEDISAGKSMDALPMQSKLDQHGCEFAPHIQIVRSGAKLVVSNSDQVLHNFHFTLAGQDVVNDAQPEGAPPREISLTKTGVNLIRCDVHPWMRGFMVVADNPYYVLTDSTGHYTLDNVPPGTYKIKMWRDNWQLTEKDGSYTWGSDLTKEASVTVPKGGAAQLNFDLP